jgi:hypothetical protein
MQGTDLFTLVPGSTTCWVALTEEYGEINGNQPGMVAKCIGVPPVTAYVFGTGCLMLRMDTGSTYQNTGTFAVPYWTLMASGILTAGTVVEGTNTTGPVFQTINTGVYTGIGVDQTLANALTVGVGHLISVTGLTTGIGEQIVATQATMTTGRFLSFNNGATEVFGVGLNGHLISTASANPPSAAITTAQGISAATLTVGATDTCGIITTTGTQNNTADSTFTVTFGKTYTVAPKGVMLTPANAAAALAAQSGAYISSVSATGFVVGVSKSSAAAATPSWNYLVIA